MSTIRKQWFIYYWNGIASLLAALGYVVIAVIYHFDLENKIIGLVGILFYLLSYTILVGSFVAFGQLFYGLIRYFKFSKGDKTYLKHCIGFLLWLLGITIVYVSEGLGLEIPFNI